MNLGESPNFSAWEYVGYDIEKELRARGETLANSHVVAILVVAISPVALATSMGNPEAAELPRLFFKVYAERPDLTLRLLSLIRAKWNDPSEAAKIQKRLMTQVYLNTRIIDNDGKTVKERKPMHLAKDADLLNANQRATQIDRIKKTRQRIKRPSMQLQITEELDSALQELKRLGIDIGDGNPSPPTQIQTV